MRLLDLGRVDDRIPKGIPRDLERALESLTCIIQRLQCRDLYDIWYLLERAGVDAGHVRPPFEDKTKHRGFDPEQFSDRFEKRAGEYRAQWASELSPFMVEIPDIDRVLRETSRHLRQNGYLWGTIRFRLLGDIRSRSEVILVR